MNKGEFAGSVFENVTKALKGGLEVTLVGFGTESWAREGRNLQTDKAIKNTAGEVAKFTPGEAP
ncbi:MAG: HU family DNA-binding protein [bacterium]